MWLKFVVMQNAVEQPPKYFGGWAGAYTINVFVVVWVLVVGFGFGGWASMINFIRQIDTFGLFTKCYQCPPQQLPSSPHLLNSTAPLPSPANIHHHLWTFQHHLHLAAITRSSKASHEHNWNWNFFMGMHMIGCYHFYPQILYTFPHQFVTVKCCCLG